tara:strand:- start:1236 stop:1673 length:438 start_codon:yes stop_codon:yes gene_type:complete
MSNRGTTEDEKIFNHQLGRNIRYLRKQKGFTQERLSRVCDVKFQQIQKYEKGSNSPHPVALVKLAAFFKVSLDKLCSQHLIEDLESFKHRVKSLEIATVDGVGIPLEGMNAEIDALINKIQKNSDRFVKDQPLVFKFDKEVDPWL